MKNQTGIKIIANNKKASFNYFLSDHLECGIALRGTEIKSIRNGGCNISDAYIVIRDFEAYIVNMNIAIYEKGNIMNHDPLRSRKLLLHKKEIMRLDLKAQKGGYTIVPTKVYLKEGRCKLEIALAKGKKLYDKREDQKEKSDKRESQRLLKDKNNY